MGADYRDRPTRWDRCETVSAVPIFCHCAGLLPTEEGGRLADFLLFRVTPTAFLWRRQEEIITVKYICVILKKYWKRGRILRGVKEIKPSES